MRIIDLFARSIPGAFLRPAAVGRVRFVIRVARFVTMLVIVLVITSVRMGGPFAVVVLAVVLMIGQLADFVTFAGPEEHEGDGRRDGGRIAEE